MKKYSNNIDTIERLSFNNLLNKDDKYKGINNRLKSNILVNNKEKFDDQNNTINSLNDEILSLKKKVNVLYKKDEELKKIKTELELSQKIASECNILKNENKLLKDKINNLEIINTEVNPDKDEMIKLKKENNVLKRNIIILKNRISDIEESQNPSEKILINIEKFKKIIDNKLNIKNDLIFNSLVQRYNITNNKCIDKKIFNKIILELI
jgi:small-conductance mechanosensitive channel